MRQIKFPGGEIDAGGKRSCPNMPNGSLVRYPEVYRALLEKFKIQYDVEICTRLPDYDDFRDFDLPSEMGSAVISERIFTMFAIHAWPTLKHHISHARIPKKSFIYAET